MSGKYGSMDLVAGQDNHVCVAPAASTATITLIVANRSDSGVRVKIAVGTTISPALKDYIYYNKFIEPNNSFQTFPIVLSANENVWVNPDANGVSARAQGYGD